MQSVIEVARHWPLPALPFLKNKISSMIFINENLQYNKRIHLHRTPRYNAKETTTHILRYTISFGISEKMTQSKGSPMEIDKFPILKWSFILQRTSKTYSSDKVEIRFPNTILHIQIGESNIIN